MCAAAVLSALFRVREEIALILKPNAKRRRARFRTPWDEGVVVALRGAELVQPLVCNARLSISKPASGEINAADSTSRQSDAKSRVKNREYSGRLGFDLLTDRLGNIKNSILCPIIS